jgi:perosamine synthetase
LVQGKKTEEFERAFAEKVGSKYAIAVSSGTAALHIAYTATVPRGSAVIVPAFSHISTASMVCMAGSTPIFCDIDAKTFTLDLEDAKRRCTSEVRAIAGVHVFGNACDIEGITRFAQEHELKVIWDAAQAHGTLYDRRDVGSFDDIVCYSFYATKNMTTGEGGMITTNDPELAERCKLLRSHGQAQKYYHPRLGFNYRMTELEAAIGAEQLKRLDQLTQRRRENAGYLTRGLSSIEEIVVPHAAHNVDHSYHQYSVLLKLEALCCSRDDFVAALKDEAVGAGVHYPTPLHEQPAFNGLRAPVDLPVVEDTCKRILSLPVHPVLTSEDLDRVIKALEKLVRSQLRK